MKYTKLIFITPDLKTLRKILKEKKKKNEDFKWLE
jgi:hypothetical protein